MSLCADHAQNARVFFSHDAGSDWVIDDDRLIHRQTQFFSIAGYAAPDGRHVLLLEQPETALVMLLLTRDPDGTRSFVLITRNEPGLIGGTNLSTTIQSTPANYQQRHGGGATPFIDLALAPTDGCHVLYDALQPDWGEFYRGKTKRFMIVETDAPLALPDGLISVPVSLSPQILMQDHLGTNDLRSALVLLHSLKPGEPVITDIAPPPAPDLGKRIPLGSFAERAARDGRGLAFLDERGVGVRHFETTSPSREVHRWQQPLLCPGTETHISLVMRMRGGTPEYAIRQMAQTGTGGIRHWHPAAPLSPPANIQAQVRTSSEGGRFWQHQITLTLAMSDGASLPEDVTWVSQDALKTYIRTPNATSVDLRMVASLALTHE